MGENYLDQDQQEIPSSGEMSMESGAGNLGERLGLSSSPESIETSTQSASGEMSTQPETSTQPPSGEMSTQLETREKGSQLESQHHADMASSVERVSKSTPEGWRNYASDHGKIYEIDRRVPGETKVQDVNTGQSVKVINFEDHVVEADKSKGKDSAERPDAGKSSRTQEAPTSQKAPSAQEAPASQKHEQSPSSEKSRTAEPGNRGERSGLSSSSEFTRTSPQPETTTQRISGDMSTQLETREKGTQLESQPHADLASSAERADISADKESAEHPSAELAKGVVESAETGWKAAEVLTKDKVVTGIEHGLAAASRGTGRAADALASKAPDQVARTIYRASDRVQNALSKSAGERVRDIAEKTRFRVPPRVLAAASRGTGRAADALASKAPDQVARTIYRASDRVQNALLKSAGTGFRVAPVASGFIEGVKAGQEAHERGVGPLATALDAVAVGGIAAADFGGPIDKAINVAHGVVNAISPEAGKYTGVAASATPSDMAKKLTVGTIDTLVAIGKGDSNQLIQHHEQNLQGKYGEAIRGYAIAADALGVYITGGTQALFQLGDKAASGALGMPAKLGDYIGGKVYDLLH